jgi:hypothetical protein
VSGVEVEQHEQRPEQPMDVSLLREMQRKQILHALGDEL